MLFAAIAFFGPAFQVVRAAKSLDIGDQLIGAGEGAGFFRVHGISLASAGYFAFAAVNVNHGGIAGLIDIDAVDAWAQNREGQVGRVYLKNFIILETPYAYAQSAFGKLELRNVVVEIQEGKPGGVAHPNRGRA